MLSIRVRKPAFCAATAAAAGRAVEPYVGLAANQHLSAPTAPTQGTAVSAAGSFAGRLVAGTAVAGTAVAVIDLPGSSPPRQAPV